MTYLLAVPSVIAGILIGLVPGAPPFLAVFIGLYDPMSGLLAYAAAYAASIFKETNTGAWSADPVLMSTKSMPPMEAYGYGKLLFALLGLAVPLGTVPVVGVWVVAIVFIFICSRYVMRFGWKVLLFFACCAGILLVSRLLEVSNPIVALGAAVWLPGIILGEPAAEMPETQEGTPDVFGGILAVFASMSVPGLPPFVASEAIVPPRKVTITGACASAFIEWWNVRLITVLSASTSKSAAAAAMLNFQMQGLNPIPAAVVLLVTFVLVGTYVTIKPSETYRRVAFMTAVFVPVVVGGWFAMLAVAAGLIMKDLAPREAKGIVYMLALFTL